MRSKHPASASRHSQRGFVNGPGFIGGGPSAFNPASLFVGGYKGSIYDFTNASKLKQHSDGTVAVASTSDPIGYVSDLSGNGLHCIQATSGLRPTWGGASAGAIGDGTQYWATGSTLDFSGVSTATIIACIQNSSTSHAGVMNLGSTSAGNVNVEVNSSTGGMIETTIFGATNSPCTFNSRSVPSADFKVVTIALDIGGADALAEVKSRINGELYGNSLNAIGPTTGNFTNSTLKLLSNYFGPLAGSILRFIIIGRTLTTTELYNAEKWCAGGLVTIIPEVPPAGAAYYEMALAYGQSRSTGVNTETEATPVLSGTRRFNDVMLTGGIHMLPGSPDYTALVPLAESTAVQSASDEGETPVSGFVELIHEQVGDAQSPFIGVTAGFPALPISDLAHGTSQYNFLIAIVTAAWRRAKESGQQFKVRAVFFLHGETMPSIGTYAADLHTLQTNLSADIKAITLQTEDVVLLIDQITYPDSALAQLAACEAYANIQLYTPTYHIPRESDNVHMTPTSYKIDGAYAGHAYKKMVIDSVTSWQPLKCTAHSTVGSVATLTFNPVDALAFDTTLVASQTNKGFRLFQSDGTTPITINSVALSGTDQVVITASGMIPAGAIVRYGFDDPAEHSPGGKGNLRDSQGITIVFDGGGLNYPMHNWCVLFQRTIN